MSYADQIFKKNAIDILENGTSTEGQEVRPHWHDGTPAYTIKHFGVADTFDLQKEFPAVTTRKTGLKSCWDEILWIFQRKSNNIHDLRPHIWDDWADEEGSIKKAYGYQIGKVSRFKVLKKVEDAKKYFDRIQKMKLPSAYIEISVNSYSKKYRIMDIDGTADFLENCNEDDYEYLEYSIWMDQMDAVLYQLKYEPFSRRVLTTLWNPEELTEMGLQPCCWSVTFNVTDEKRADGKLTLNMLLNQRSNDMLAAYNWNTCQYALLLMAVAQVSGMVAGKFLHVIADQHIYDRHVDIMKELLERPEYPAPKVWLDPEVTNFYDFTYDSIHVEDYVTGEQVSFEVAV